MGKFRKSNAAVKLHTLLNLPGNFPIGISITNAKIHDVNALDDFFSEARAVYIFDRSYTDFARLYMNSPRRGILYHPYKTGFYTLKDYPEQFRRIRYFAKSS